MRVLACPALQPRAELVEARLEPAARPSTGSGRGRDCRAPRRNRESEHSHTGNARALGEEHLAGVPCGASRQYGTLANDDSLVAPYDGPHRPGPHIHIGSHRARRWDAAVSLCINVDIGRRLRRMHVVEHADTDIRPCRYRDRRDRRIQLGPVVFRQVVLGPFVVRAGDHRAGHADGRLCAGRPRRTRLLVRVQRSAQGDPRLPCRCRATLAGRPGRDRAVRARRLHARSARRPCLPGQVRERCGTRARRHDRHADRAAVGRADAAGCGGVGEGWRRLSDAGGESPEAAAPLPPSAKTKTSRSGPR